MVKVHPLAGKCGEGPPLAPDLWKWRAGNRQSDMYFTSPTGERFRSRPELNVYLATLANPPPVDSFQWRVTEEFLEENQVASWDSKTPQKQSGDGSSEKEKGEGRSKAKAGKRREVTKDAPDKGRKKVKLEKSSPLEQPSTPEESPLPIPKPVPQRSEAAKVAGCISTPTPKPRPKMKASKKDKFDKNWEDDKLFSRVLASKCSWNWLYDNEATTKFLAEAEKLTEKSAAELADLRNILLHRGTDSISRYSNPVLRIFIQILRNVQPPSTMGKVELVDLVVNWKCKMRHYWCLLETSRLAPGPQPSSSNVDGSSSWSRDDKTTREQATDVTNEGSIFALRDMRNVRNIEGNSSQGESKAMLEDSDTCNEEIQLEVTLRDIQETVRNIEDTQLTSSHIDSPVDLSGKEFTTSHENSQRVPMSDGEPGKLADSGNTRMEYVGTRMRTSSTGKRTHFTAASEDLGVTPRPEHASESVYNVQYKSSESVVILDRITSTPRGGQSTTYHEDDQIVRLPRSDTGSSSAKVSKVDENTPLQTPQIASFPLSYHFPRESSICWCKICSKNQAFCRGCMCCLCPHPVRPEDEWMAVRCNCKHLCHIKCALENNLAGVIKDLNLDGELSCPSCSSKVDLWPFFEKSFHRLCTAESKSNPTDLETLALQVLRLLDGTENTKYTYLLKLVVELHDLMKKFSIQNLVRQLLVEIKEELHEPLRPDSDATTVAEDAMEAAMKNRAEIEHLFNTLGKAYQNVIDQTRRLRAAQVSDSAKRIEFEHTEIVKGNAFSVLLAEQIDNQNTKAEEEFQRLVQFKSSMVKPDNPTLVDIDSSMNTWLDAVRVQRRAVEAAETELHLLKSSQKEYS